MVVVSVGSRSAWRIAMPLAAALQNSHQDGGRVFSSSWRILEPYGSAQSLQRECLSQCGVRFLGELDVGREAEFGVSVGQVACTVRG